MRKDSKKRWAGLVFISLAVSLIIVDSTIVNVAIPSIVGDLGATSTQVQWIQESYTLVFAALLLLFGVLADRFARRRLLILGISIFALASILAATSQSGNLLIGSGFLRGIDGAMVLPSTLSIIYATFQGKERALAFAVWGSTIGGMSAVGTLLGGWLTTSYSSRWAFGVNIPLGVVVVVGTLLAVAESRDTAFTKRIDFSGAILSVLASAALVFGLIEGRNYGWWLVNNPFTVGAWSWPVNLSPVPVAFAVGVLSLALFISLGRARSRRGVGTMLDFGLFPSRPSATVTLRP